MARAKSEFKQQKNIPIKNKKQSKKVKPQKIKNNPKKFVNFATESMQSQVKAAAGNQEKKSLGVKRKQQDVDNGVKKFKNNKDQAILRVHNSNNNIQNEVKDSQLKLIKSSGSLKQDNLKIQSLDAKKKSVVKMGKVETSEQNTDIKKMDIKSSHCSESIEKIPSAQQDTGCRKRRTEILKQQKLENTKQDPTQPNKVNNAEKVLLVQKVRSRRRKKRAVSQIVTQLSTVKHGFPNKKNSSEKVENMKPTQPQPKLKEKSVQKAKNVKEIVVDPISDTYLFGSLKVKQGGIHKNDKLDDCIENLKKQKYLNIVQEPIQQTTNSLKKKSDTSLDANQKQNEQFNCEKIPKENRDMENSKRSKPQNLAQEPIKPEAIEKFQSGFLRGTKPESIAQNSIKEKDSDRSQSGLKKKKKHDKCEKISKGSNPENKALKPIKKKKAEPSQTGLIEEVVSVKQVLFEKQNQDSCAKKSEDKRDNFIEKLKNISQNQIQQMINNAEQNKTEEDKQNILKGIQDNFFEDSDKSQSGLKKKKKHDKCEKISKGSNPENKALKPIKKKKAEPSQTGLIEEVVPVKQVLFEKQNQDSCAKKSEDKQVNFSEKLKGISKNQIEQMVNKAEQKKTEDQQNILKELQDNLEKKSIGSNPECIIQNSIKEKDSDRSQSGLKKKKKHDKCEKISKGSNPENKALEPIKRKKSEASLTGLIEEVVPVKQVLFEKQNQDSCAKKSKDKQVNFREKLKGISQNQIEQMINKAEEKKTEEDQQNILKEIQDNFENKSIESNPECIIQNSIKEKKKRHDKCEKISKESNPENKALKPIKKKKAEPSQTGLIEEVVPVKQVLFEKQNQDSCAKKSEDKQVNFSEKLKGISQNQIEQMVNKAEQKKTEDQQNILKELQDNLEKKSIGSNPECIIQNSIKEKDSDRSQSGLKKKKKHDKCEKISKGSNPENKALEPIKRKKSEASLTGLIEEVVPVKQVLFEKQNQDSCAKKSKDKQVNFREKLKGISQNQIEQMINKAEETKTEEDQQNILKEIQDNLEKKSRGSNPECIIQNSIKEKKKKHDKCEKISKGSNPENKALKPIKKKAEPSHTGLIEEVVPVKQVQFQEQDQDSCAKKSEDKQVNFSEKFKSISQNRIQQMINNAEQNKTEEDKQNILKEIQDNLEKKSRGSNPECIIQNSIKEKKKKHDKCEKISKGSNPENKALEPIKRKKSEASLTGLIEEVVPVKQVLFEKENQDSSAKKSEDKQVNFSEKFKSISQNRIQQMFNNAEQNKTEVDKQTILKEIQDNLDKPENIAQNSIKDKDSDRSQSSLKKKEKHDKCEKISKGLKPENKASKPIKRKKSEASLTGLIEEVVPVKQVQFQKQDQDTCAKKSEDKQVNFIEKFKNISQNQIQQMINNAEQNKTEVDKQTILKEIQDNLEKKSRGSKPESIAQNSIKEKDFERSQSGLKKKKKRDKCEKISKGSNPENKASKPIKRKKAEASQTGLIEEVVPVKQVLFEKQNQDSCAKKSEDKQVNFSEKFKGTSQNQIEQMIDNAEQNKTEEDKQNILKEIQDNPEKKSRGSKPESIAQNSIKDEDSGKSQSGLKKKKKHDKCEKISKGSNPENKALKPIKSQVAEASLTGLIEEIVPVTQVQFQEQNQDSCAKKSEDMQVNFREKFKGTSQNQIQQMINNAEQNKSEEDKQNILKELQDNPEKKSRGSKPESVAQNPIKEKDSDRSQSGLKKKKKHDKCEKISKGSNPENKALKPIKRKKAEASQTGLIEEVVPVKQVRFEKQNQDSCEKKSEDKQDNFKENLKKAKFENIEQEPIQQSINDQKKNYLTLQDIIQNQNKENNHKMLKENQDTYVKISKGSKPGYTNLKPIKKRTAEEESLTGLIDEIVPVKQVKIQKRDQDNGENKSKEKFENIIQELINKTTNGKQEEVQPSQSGLIGRFVLIKPVAICEEINCETNLKSSKPENTTLHQNCVSNIKPEESFKAHISKSPLNQVYDDQSKQINCSVKSIEKTEQKLNQQVNNTQEMRVETSKSGLIGRILPVMQDNKRDSCTKNSKRKREPIEMQVDQLENKVQKVKSVESELKRHKISNLVKPTQLVAPGKVTICQSDTRITNLNCENNISPLQQENSEQYNLHLSMDEMLDERWRKMKVKVEKSENKIRSQFMRCTEYVLTNEGTEELTEEPMQTKKADETKQTSLIGKFKSLLKRRLTCHF